MHDPSPFDVPPEPIDPIGAPNETPSADDCNLALIAHLSGCAGLFAGGLIGFLGPLVVYLAKKDSSTFVGEQAKDCLLYTSPSPRDRTRSRMPSSA